MQQFYETPVLEVVVLETTDVVVASQDYDFNDWFTMAEGGPEC